jgi:hypothetical protein
MEDTGGHYVARIDDTVTAANLHARAEAVAVPDFNYLERMIEGIAEGLTHLRRHRGVRAAAAGPAAPGER